jgi:hypothetical protein
MCYTPPSGHQRIRIMKALDFYTFAAIIVMLAVAWYVWRL